MHLTILAPCKRKYAPCLIVSVVPCSSGIKPFCNTTKNLMTCLSHGQLGSDPVQRPICTGTSDSIPSSEDQQLEACCLSEPITTSYPLVGYL